VLNKLHWALLEKLTVVQQVQKFPSFMEPRGLAPHSQQPMLSYINPTLLRSPMWSLPLKFSNLFFYILISPIHDTFPTHLSFKLITVLIFEVQTTILPITQFSTAFYYFPLWSKYSSAPCSQTPLVYVLPLG